MSRTDLLHVSNLEKVNQIVDLSIDRGLVWLTEVDNGLFVYGDQAKKCLDAIRESDPAEELILDIYLGDFPIEGLLFTPDVAELLNVECPHPQKIVFQDAQHPELLRHWASLYWAKKVRGEILRNTTTKWSSFLDELLRYVEKNLPAPNDELDWKITMFNFLMELSALEVGQGSYGFAERARRFKTQYLNKEGGIGDDRKKRYDRWIWYNKGLAFQHMDGQHKKAVLEYNYVVRKFWEDVQKDENPEADLEFLLNIVTALYQRAEVNLQLQLGYHALETLERDVDSKEWLNRLAKSSNSILKESATGHQVHEHLIRLKAFLQLEAFTKAKEVVNFHLAPNLFKGSGYEWNDSTNSFPDKPNDFRTSFETQFVEETATWFLEQARGFNDILDTTKESDFGVISGRLCLLSKRLDAFNKDYWNWVMLNDKDERVYFSRWGQFLKISTEAVESVSSSNFTIIEKETKCCLQSILSLYMEHRKKIPNRHLSPPRLQEKGNEALRLETFTSDDLPDLVDGLSGFYKMMAKFLLSVDESLTKVGDVIKAEFLKKNYGDPKEQFKQDHFNLLDALDEYEEEFGEKRRVNLLMRCNDRLIWNQPMSIENCCNNGKCWEENCVDDDGFKQLLPCIERLQLKSAGNDDILFHYNYEEIMERAETHLTRHMQDSSLHPAGKNSLHFIGLQRWNSETPAQGKSVGGGYFIYNTDEKGRVKLGIAVDPGFDFVRNFFRMGFSLHDIDIVLISHSHPDHIWDFESIVQLLNESDSKAKSFHRINVILSLGSYKRVQHVINSPTLRRFVNPLVIDIRKELQDDYLKVAIFEFKRERNDDSGSKTGHGPPRWVPVLPSTIQDKAGSESVTIASTLAYHDDYSEESDSFGFKITYKTSNNSFVFGYMGDTRWVNDDLYNESCPIFNDCTRVKKRGKCYESIVTDYTECDAILVHLGSLIDHKAKAEKLRHFKHYKNKDNCDRLIRSKNHLYLVGTIRLLSSLLKSGQHKTKQQLILLGEFGEELRGGIRKDLVRRLNDFFRPKNPQILPVDVGLDVRLTKLGEDNDSDSQSFSFLCAICENYVSLDRIRYRTFGQDEALFYLCETCNKATPDDVRQNKFAQLYEIGRELES